MFQPDTGKLHTRQQRTHASSCLHTTTNDLVLCGSQLLYLLCRRLWLRLLQVAIKVMPKQRGKLTRERTLQKLMKEVGILQKMQGCRNTVRLLGCFEGSDEVMVVTQYCAQEETCRSCQM